MKTKISPGQTSLFDSRYCLFCGANLSGRQRKYCSRRCQLQAKRTPEDSIDRIARLRAKGLSYQQISILTGISVGSVHAYAAPLPGKHNLKEVYLFKSPDRKTVHSVRPSKIGCFCKTFNLAYPCLRDVWKGKQKQHKGWTKVICQCPKIERPIGGKPK